MTPAVASERSIFSKNHCCNSYIEFSVNTYAPIFRGVNTRDDRKLYTNRHTHRHTLDSHNDDNNEKH